jgi:hypothetical protein
MKPFLKIDRPKETLTADPLSGKFDRTYSDFYTDPFLAF